MRLIILTYALCHWMLQLRAQEQLSYGFLPAITTNVDVKDNWKLVFKLESRLFHSRIDQSTDLSSYSTYTLTDFSGFVQRKMAVNHSLAAGYQVRSELNTPLIHRFVLQYTNIGKAGTFRTSHRVRLDETLENKQWTARMRYRYSLELPFNGERVDDKEFYSILNGEAIVIHQDGQVTAETRLAPLIGFKMNAMNKLEIGPDIRLSGLFSDSERLNNWFTLTWFFSF